MEIVQTAGFTLPLLQLLSDGAKVQPNQARALILTPTRELAIQISESFTAYGKHTGLRNTVIFGGVKQGSQVRAFHRT